MWRAFGFGAPSRVCLSRCGHDSSFPPLNSYLLQALRCPRGWLHQYMARIAETFRFARPAFAQLKPGSA
jgi:hypothetical protein